MNQNWARILLSNRSLDMFMKHDQTKWVRHAMVWPLCVVKLGHGSGRLCLKAKNSYVVYLHSRQLYQTLHRFYN